MLAWARWWVTTPDQAFIDWSVALLALEGYFQGLTLAQISDALYQLRRQYYSPPQVPSYTIAWPTGGNTEQEIVDAWKQWVDAAFLPDITPAQIATFLRAIAARVTAVNAYL